MKTQLALVLVLVVAVGVLNAAKADQGDAKCRKYAKQEGFTDEQLAKIGPMLLVYSKGWSCHPEFCCADICESMFRVLVLEAENKTVCCCSA